MCNLLHCFAAMNRFYTPSVPYIVEEMVSVNSARVMTSLTTPNFVNFPMGTNWTSFSVSMTHGIGTQCRYCGQLYLNGGYEERLCLLGSKLKKSREMLKWAKQQVHHMSLNYLNYHSYSEGRAQSLQTWAYTVWFEPISDPVFEQHDSFCSWAEFQLCLASFVVQHTGGQRQTSDIQMPDWASRASENATGTWGVTVERWQCCNKSFHVLQRWKG